MIRVGLIGVGKWGQNHLKSLSRLNCSIVGISDIDIQKAELAKEYSTNFYIDYKEIIKQVDAVIVATPTNLHFKIVKDCLYAGKNVLVEKPIAFSSAESNKLVALAKKEHCLLSVGYLFRFNNAIIRAKELLKNIGEIQYITCRYLHSTKPPRKDSGVIPNLAIHQIDTLNFITQKIPIKVITKKKNLLSQLYEDSAIIMLDYGPFFATIEVSCTHPEKKRDMWIIAEKEKVYIDYLSQKLIRYPLKVTHEEITREEPITEDIQPNEPLLEELRYFLNLVGKKKDRVIYDIDNIGKENYYTTHICELSIQSAEKGSEMKIQ